MTTPGQFPELPRYEITEKVRSDSLTDLYRARQEGLERAVLVKSLREGVLPSSPFARAIEHEAKLLAELDHDNIPRLYDFQRLSDRMWLVLENVEGDPLDVLLERHGALPPEVAASIALQISRALSHAHRRGIVHRDVQPRNVFVSPDGHVKLLGFAVATDERVPTAPELLDGTTGFGPPHYMSPEQVLGEAPDPRSDLFSLGVVLYEMLCHKRPFDAPDSRAVTQRIRHDAPVPLSRQATDLPRALDHVTTRLLQKLPSDRYDDATAVEQALSDYLGDASRQPARQVRDYLDPSASAGRASASAVRPRGEDPPRLWPGLVVCLGLLVVGATAIEVLAARRAAGGATDGSRLELVPTPGAELRVVVDPWAHVVVDGQRVDTTPFARPIPLSPGIHYVRLEHPHAPTERRTLRLAPGESLLLDVKMELDLPPPAASAPAELPVTGDPETP